MLKITYSDRFQKHYKKLSSEAKSQFRQKLSLFVSNPFHPSLRVKRIQGTTDLFEFSVNMDGYSSHLVLLRRIAGILD